MDENQVTEQNETVEQPANEGGEAAETPSAQPDIEKMFAERLEKERQTWHSKEVEPLRKQYEEMNQKMVQGQLAWLEKMGWYSPEKPKPPSVEDIDKRFKDLETKIQQERVQQYHAQRIESGWSKVSAKYPKLAKIKYFQNAVLAEYAENPNRDFADIGDEAAKQFQAIRSAEEQAERTERNRPDRRVVPSGRGAGAGSGGGGKSSKKMSVAEKIRARLKDSEE